MKCTALLIINGSLCHLLTKKEGLSLCIPQDKYLMAFGNIFSRPYRHARKDTIGHLNQEMEYTFEKLTLLREIIGLEGI